MKHTPGNWFAELCLDGWGSHGVRANKDSDIEVCVLSQRESAFCPDDDEAIANALLIAAAPSLLAALRALYEATTYQTASKFWTEDEREATAMVVEALAKAEGRS